MIEARRADLGEALRMDAAICRAARRVDPSIYWRLPRVLARTVLRTASGGAA